MKVAFCLVQVASRFASTGTRRQPTRGGPPDLGLGEVLTTPPREKTLLRNIHKARCFLWRQNNPEVNYFPTQISKGECFRGSITQQEKGHFLGTCNIRSLYTAGSLTAAAGELARYKLDLVGVQEVRWDKGGTVRAGDYIILYEKGN